jgi:hypothetical protein
MQGSIDYQEAYHNAQEDNHIQLIENIQSYSQLV